MRQRTDEPGPPEGEPTQPVAAADPTERLEASARTERFPAAPPTERVEAAPAGDGQVAETPTGGVGAPPRLADGLELLGRYEDSGYKEPPFMARRADGQMIQLPGLLYLIAERADGHRGYEEIAREVSEAVGRGLDADGVQMLVEKKLRPLGVLATADGSSPKLQKADPLLALRFRAALVPKRVVAAVTTLFRPLFWPLLMALVVGGLVAVDVWLFFVHGVAQSLRDLLYQPLYLILTFALVAIGAAFHEIGHATACKYGGAEPGVMGAGIYIVWPAFYTDVTDAYRLGKGGRLRTDLGGVYFNCIFILATTGVYFATRFEPLLILIYLQHLEMIRQLLPILRLDGYYVLSDLTGVPDLFGRIGAILKSLIPGRKADARVNELKPWVRVVTTGWVLAVVPFLAFNVVMIATYAPRILATGWDSFWVQLEQTSTAFGGGRALSGAAGVLQLVALVLPAAGIAYGLGRTSVRLSSRAWRGTEGRPALRTGTVLGIAGTAAVLGLLWWPDGDYKPIQPTERWTVPEAVAAVSTAAAGEPAFAEVPEESRSNAAPAIDGDGGAAPGEDSTETEPAEEVTEEPTEEVTEEPTEEPTGDVTPTPEVTTTP